MSGREHRHQGQENEQIGAHMGRAPQRRHAPTAHGGRQQEREHEALGAVGAVGPTRQRTGELRGGGQGRRPAVVDPHDPSEQHDRPAPPTAASLARPGMPGARASAGAARNAVSLANAARTTAAMTRAHRRRAAAAKANRVSPRRERVGEPEHERGDHTGCHGDDEREPGRPAGEGTQRRRARRDRQQPDGGQPKIGRLPPCGATAPASSGKRIRR